MSGSIITFTCECGTAGRARQYSYDARPPYCMPRLWTTDNNGRGVCPDCSQAKRDATGVQVGDKVFWESGNAILHGSVRAVAIQRYGAVSVVVQPAGGTWRDQCSIEPAKIMAKVRVEL